MSQIDPLSPPPSRAVTQPRAWSGDMHAFLSQLPPMVEQYNAATAMLLARLLQAFSGTSAANITIGTGLKEIPASPGMALIPGHIILLSAELDADAAMTGTVITYDAGTGALEVDVTATSGSGDYEGWHIGISPTVELSGFLETAGGTLTGLLTLAAATTGSASLNIPHGTAPTSPTAGDLWSTTAGLFARIDSVTRQVAMTSGAQSLTFKTLVDPTLQGTPTTDIFTITDGASVTIDPADGEVQTWTLGANRTPTLTSITAGKGVLLMVDDGSARTLTLSGVTWLNNDGAAPTLKTSGYTPILIFNIAGTRYAWLCGDAG